MNKITWIFCFCILFSSCEDPVPLTGTLQISINIDSLDPSTPYALFTEATYLSGQYLPLRQGLVANQEIIEFKELLPGTYVFVLYSTNELSFTGQVVSGKQSQLNVVPS